MIPYGKQEISEDDVRAVVGVLRSDWLTQGPAVPAFERAVADYCRVKYAVAANSGTSALHLACMALGVGPGDRVWTSAITFAASANCALYCGAQADFVDIDARSYNMSVQALDRKLEAAKRAGALPKVVIPVHLAGLPCDMEAIGALGHQYGFRIVEDASHAIGARYRDQPLGDCRYSDIAVFSFHPVKVITSAEGGMATTNDATLAKRMQLLRTHGITRDCEDMVGASEGPWYYEQTALGYNYRMTDVHAALGLSQMHRVDEFVVARNRIAGRYDELLEGLPVTTPSNERDAVSAYHLYVVRLKLNKIRRSHREVFEAMRGSGIGVNLHYIPVYRHPYHANHGVGGADCPEAERYYAEAITLPLYPALSIEQQDRVVKALDEACA